MDQKKSRSHLINLLCCVALIALILFFYVLYGINMAHWKDNPDYGWRAMYDSGPNVVAELFGRGWQAGLRVGDHILAINGSVFDTFEELFFSLRNPLPGASNTYTVVREGKLLDITVVNGRMGLTSVLRRSGPLLAVGFLYIFIGVLVYFMKPLVIESRVFLLMAVSMGISISYASPADLLHPLWLFDVRQFLDVFLPAPMIHLALIFPRRHGLTKRLPLLWAVPYVFSLVLFVLFETMATAYWNSPSLLNAINNLYLLTAVLIFIASIIWNLVGKPSPKIKLQSQVIFIGIVIGFFIPSSELLARTILNLNLFSDPAIYFALFLAAFPLAIGYTIIRHDLFAIDTMVRRTYGYGLSMAIVVGTFAATVSILNLAFSGLDVWRTPTFSLIFAMVVVIFFGPLHARVQALVNKLFYRTRVDYKDAVTAVSSALTSVLRLDEVIYRIIYAVHNVMQIDSAKVIYVDTEISNCIIFEAAENGDRERIVKEHLDLEDPVVSLLKNEGKMVSLYDLNENPEYEDVRAEYTRRLEELGAALVIPMIFQFEIIGVLAIGRKKSGRYYTSEDIDLLNTLANQGAVAIENARLAERMKDEEVVRTNLSRYLSPQVVERVIRQKMDMDLGGDRKVVTVLISDIRDFTTLSENHPPDHLAVILNEYFTDMANIIFRHRGSLDKYVGDSIVAVFGSLIEVSNSTQLAVEASVDMMKRMGELNVKWEVEHAGFRMDIGVGIDRGEVFLGNVGSPERMEFTVLGRAVNTASILSEQSKPGQILITDEAVKAIEKEVPLREAAPVVGKKKKEKIRVFEVLHGNGYENLSA